MPLNNFSHPQGSSMKGIQSMSALFQCVCMAQQFTGQLSYFPFIFLLTSVLFGYQYITTHNFH